MRLPLKPIGVHSNRPASIDEVPDDLPSDTGTAATHPASTATQKVNLPTATDKESTTQNMDKSVGNDDSYWTLIKIKFEAAKTWADGVIAKLGGA